MTDLLVYIGLILSPYSGARQVKILVIESKNGKIIESQILEGDYFEIVKQIAQEALKKWSPDSSDFVAVRDVWDIELDETITESLKKRFEELKLIVEEEGKKIARIPVYTISYDNRMLGTEDYMEKGIYMIVPFIDEQLKDIFETEAADLTAEKSKEEPKGFIDLSN